MNLYWKIASHLIRSLFRCLFLTYVWIGSYPFFIVIRCVQFLVNSQVYAQCCPLMFESLNSDIAHKLKVGLPTSDFSLLPCLKTCIKNTFLNCYDDNTFCQRLSPVFFTRPIADRSMDTDKFSRLKCWCPDNCYLMSTKKNWMTNNNRHKT